MDLPKYPGGKYLPRDDVIKLDYENGETIGCILHEVMKFKEFFVIPCHKTFMSIKELNTILMEEGGNISKKK